MSEYLGDKGIWLVVGCSYPFFLREKDITELILKQIEYGYYQIVDKPMIKKVGSLWK